MSFIFEVAQNYILKAIKKKTPIKSVNFLPASIKSMNPMQKYSHIIELFDSTLNMLAFMFLFPINSLISLGTC